MKVNLIKGNKFSTKIILLEENKNYKNIWILDIITGTADITLVTIIYLWEK